MKRRTLELAKNTFNWAKESEKLKLLYSKLLENNTQVEKYNILYIENGVGFGGAVTCLCALIKGINKDKYSPIVLSSHNDEATKRLIVDAGATFFYVRKYRRPELINKLIKKIANLGTIAKRVFLLPLFLIECLCRIPFIIRSAKVIKENNVNIIHLNNSIECNIEGVILAKLLSISAISHVRAPEYNSFESRFVARYVNCFIPMSKIVEKSLLELRIPQKKIKIVYDGIDLKESIEKSEDVNIQELNKFEFNKHNVGLFACLTLWKGHKVFIKAVDILIKKMGLKDCNFFIVGDAPDKKSTLKEELLDLVKELGLLDYIFFTGQQDNVFGFMDRMDIIVHTSTEPEPFGRVIIEAMAQGKPVIATKMGGPLEIIEDGVNGFLIPANNPSILAEEILALLNNNDRRRQISIAAHNTVKEKFGINNFVKEIEDIYEKVAR